LSSNFESFGIALIEAASFGDIIVSTDVGVAKELVSNGNGAVVSVGDIEALAASLDRFMLSGDLEIFSEVTEGVCRNKFDWDNIVQRLEKKLLDISRG